MQCPAGELAVRKAVTNQSQTYYFDIEKCKQCPHREGCYKEGAKSKTFSVTLKCDEHCDSWSSEAKGFCLFCELRHTCSYSKSVKNKATTVALFRIYL